MHPRFDGSVMASLAELRALEHDRIHAERQAIEAADAARRQAALAAEQQHRDQAQAQLVAEREAALALTLQQTAAEREARLQLLAIETTERERHAAALAYARLAEEQALRRAEVARIRPRWMIAITVAATLAAGALGWVAIDRSQQADAAAAQAEAAVRARDDAKRASLAVVAALATMKEDLSSLDRRVEDARVVLEGAITASAQAKVAAELQQIRAAQAAVEQRRRAAAEAAALAARRGGLQISDECKRNSLAPGCR